MAFHTVWFICATPSYTSKTADRYRWIFVGLQAWHHWSGADLTPSDRIHLISEISHRLGTDDWPLIEALVHESELARNEPDSQVHHLPRAYDDGLPSSAIRLRM